MATGQLSKDWLKLVLLSTIWGTTFQFQKVAVTTISPVEVVTVRFVIAALALFAALRLTGGTFPSRLETWIYLAAMAVVGNIAPFLLISWGQQFVDSAPAGILMATMPLATMLMAHFFVAEERATAGKALGFVVGFGGIVLLMTPKLLGTASPVGPAAALGIVPELAITAGAVCYAANTVLARRLSAIEPLAIATTTVLISAVIMLPIAIAGGETTITAAPNHAVWSNVWLGLISTAIAFMLYYSIIDSAGATFVSTMNYLIPVVAYLGGILALAERPTWQATAALVVILFGIWLANRNVRHPYEEMEDNA